MLAAFRQLTVRLKATAVTIWGGTPGLQMLVSSRVLPCGCQVGVYHTWRNGTVGIVDAQAPACADAGHVPNAVLWRRPAVAAMEH